MHTTPLLWLYPPGLDTWLFSVHVIHQACPSMGLLALLGRWSLCFLIVVACWAVKSSQLHQHLKLHLVALYRMKLLCFCYAFVICQSLAVLCRVSTCIFHLLGPWDKQIGCDLVSRMMRHTVCN